MPEKALLETASEICSVCLFWIERWSWLFASSPAESLLIISFPPHHSYFVYPPLCPFFLLTFFFPPPMVQLILTPSRGNAGGRDFPYQGYLGLTPVRVDGSTSLSFTLPTPHTNHTQQSYPQNSRKTANPSSQSPSSSQSDVTSPDKAKRA